MFGCNDRPCVIAVVERHGVVYMTNANGAGLVVAVRVVPVNERVLAPVALFADKLKLE